MRVLYFSEGFTNHDLRFLRLLSAGNHEVLFLTLHPSTPGNEPGPLPDSVAQLNPIGPRCSGVDCVPFLIQLLKDLRPDVVQAGPIQSCSYLVAKTGYRPLISVSWGSDMLVSACRDEESKTITRFALDHSDFLVCDCESVRKAFHQYANILPDRIVQFPWGVDLDSFSQGVAPSGIRSELGWEKAYVIFSNRTWAANYGIEVVLDAFATAFARRPDLRLILAGDGPLAAYVRTRLEKQGLTEYVYCPSRVSQREMPAYLTCSDLYLSCSPSDGSSISLIEAMACGLPVVASDADGNREWIEPGINGWLAPADNPDAFASTIILSAEQSKEDRMSMSNRNRLAAEQRADWIQNSKKLLSAVRSLGDIGESGRTHA